MAVIQARRRHDHRATRMLSFDPRHIASGLGWFSIGLGLAATLAPDRVARMIGIRRSRTAATVLRLVGLRELGAGLGILSRSRSARWLWARVAGDVMDLGLLTTAMRSRRGRRDRIGAATAAVVGVTVLDALSGAKLSRSNGAAAGAVTVRRAITINRRPDEVYRFWRDFTNLPRFMQRVEAVERLSERRSHWRVSGPGGMTLEWDAEITDDVPNERIAWRVLPGSPVDHAGIVRLRQAPGGRGTEAIVEMQYTPPGGGVGATVAKLVGAAPEQELAEALRRLKQILETGEVVISEGSERRVAQPPATRRGGQR
jgi:uncharacterized membrane protein